MAALPRTAESAAGAGTIVATPLGLRQNGIDESTKPKTRRTTVLPLIAERRSEIAALCRRFGVRRLAVFGSAARGEDFDPARSDLDFLVEFDFREPDALSLKSFFGFKDSLEELFGRSVDFVEPGAMRNPYLKASIERSREPVFEA